MYFLGIDLGGTSIKAGLVDKNYNIVQTATCPTKKEATSDVILEDMANLCMEVIQKEQIPQSDVHSIGVGVPGPTIPSEGIIRHTTNLNFKNVNLKVALRKYLDIEVYAENDANVAALGEVLLGAAKGAKSAVVITLGTGVGGGIILDGKIYNGAFFGAGEIGHQVINFESDLICGCRRLGCYEQYASATALIRMAKEDPSQMMIDMAGGLNSIVAKTVFDAKDAGDKKASELLDKYFYYVSIGIANLINILQPEYIILGGAMSAQKEKLIEPITHYVKQQTLKGLELETQIKVATLGNSAGIIGAALLGTTLQR
ncbi:MAG: glucokinase [Epulopiscium sp. Nuni2H_MBin003]|nr:MAG: glucokinase [Epulopiscium sp. Nuni2H_MBin003]